MIKSVKLTAKIGFKKSKIAKIGYKTGKIGKTQYIDIYIYRERELVNGSKLVRLEKSIESRIGKMDQIDQIGNSDFANLRMSCRSPILHAIG